MFFQWPDLFNTYYLCISHEADIWELVFGQENFMVVYYINSALISLNNCSYSSIVLSISYDCFLTVKSFQIYHSVLLCICMCLMSKRLFMLTIACSCWIFTVAFNSHEISTGTTLWNLKFSAKIINILNNKVNVYRIIEFLIKLASLFNLAKNSHEVSTTCFPMTF